MPTQVAACLPHRTFSASWSRAFRLTHPSTRSGKWTEEEDAQLRDLHARHGSKWTKIGAALGRLPNGCKDRWRHIGIAPEKNAGRWAPGEEAALQAAVEQYSAAAGLVCRPAERVPWCSLLCAVLGVAMCCACNPPRPVHLACKDLYYGRLLSETRVAVKFYTLASTKPSARHEAL